MPRGRPKRRIHREPKIEDITGEHSPPQHVDLPPTSPYPQQESGKIQYVPEFRRVVLVETREVWSDGSVTNIVRSLMRGNL